MAFDDVNSSDNQVADTSGDRSTDSGSISRGAWDDIAASSSTTTIDKSTSTTTPDSLDMGGQDIYASSDTDFSPSKNATAVLDKPADTTAAVTTDNAAATAPTDTTAAVTTDNAAGTAPTDTTAAVTTDNAAGTAPTDNSPAGAGTNPTDQGTGNPPDSTSSDSSWWDKVKSAASDVGSAITGGGDTNPPSTTDSMTGTVPTDNSAGAPPPSSDSPSFFSHPLDWAENKAQSVEQGASDLWNKVTGSGDSPSDKPADQPAQPADNPADNAEQQALQKIQDDPQVQAQKQQLEANLTKLHDQQKLGDDDYKQAQDNIAKLEQRAAKTDPPLDPSEVSGTLSNVNKMLENTSQTPIPVGSRQEIALDVLNQAADPTKINQGDHATCTTASLEVATYTKSPAEASDLVQQVTSTGQYVTKDGLTVKVPPQDLQTPDDAAYGMAAARTYGSQIFQDTAANIKWAEYNKEHGTNLAFVHDHAESPKGKPPTSGDDVVDLNTGKKVSREFPGVSSSDLADTYHQITGKPSDGMVIQNTKYADGNSSGTADVSSPQELDKVLSDAKANHKFPLMMRVHTGNEPFYDDSDGGKAGGSGGWHMVTVTDYDPNTKNVQVENTWGPKANHGADNPIPLNELYQATKNSSDFPIPGGAGDTGSAGSAGDTGVAAPPTDAVAAAKDVPADAGVVAGVADSAATGVAGGVAAGAEAGAIAGAPNPSDATPVTNDLVGQTGDKPAEMQKPVDNAGDASAKPGDDDASKQQCEAQKNKLEENLKSKLSDSNPMDKEMHREIDQKIDAFEHRDPPVSAAERAKFYGELNTLMEAKDTKLPKGKDGTDKDARIGLVDEMLENANKPKEIQQGQNMTCGAAALETKLYTTNPSAAAHMITQVAMTGEFTPAGGGNPVKVDGSVLKPDSDSKDALGGTEGAGRNYASQIFEGTAVSMAQDGAGYHEGKPNHGGRPPGNHEWVNENGKEVPFKGLTPTDIQSVESQITGNPATPVIEKPSSWNEKDGQNTDGGYHIKDEADLKNHLAELKKQGKLPAILMVDSAQEPFKTDSGGGKAGGSGGTHFVTVTDIDDNGNVAVANQWGPEADHSDPNDHSKWIPSGRLYQATTG